MTIACCNRAKSPTRTATRAAFTFSPLGLLESTFVRGKNPTEGDQDRPSVRMEYGFLAFENSPPASRQPIFVRTIRQIHHDTELDVPLPERDETITTVEYSDGFGRLLQTRTQGEEVRFGDEHFGGGEAVLPAKQSDGAGGDVVGRRNTDALKPNVVVSGWQIYDNKGQVVEKYEPFFSEGWDYGQPDDSKTGQKVAMFYDPRGHAIRTLESRWLGATGDFRRAGHHRRARSGASRHVSSRRPGKPTPMTRTTTPDAPIQRSRQVTNITGTHRPAS